MAEPDTIARVQDAAGHRGDAEFLELLRWHRAVAGLPDLEWSSRGAYRQGVAELTDARARELLHDIRHASPTWAILVRKVGGVESVDELGDFGGYRGGGVDSLSGDGQLEGAVALEGPDQALDG